MSVKNSTIYLAAGGEVGPGSTLHDTLGEAMATESEYVDVFVNGVRTECYLYKDGQYTDKF